MSKEETREQLKTYKEIIGQSGPYSLEAMVYRDTMNERAKSLGDVYRVMRTGVMSALKQHIYPIDDPLLYAQDSNSNARNAMQESGICDALRGISVVSPIDCNP